MKSMTGYGNSAFHSDEFELEIEIKSVNSRFLDLKISSPRELQFLDNLIKESVSRYIKRAKAELRIFFSDKRIPEFQLDENKLLAYKNLLIKVKKLIGDDSTLSMQEILSQPDILSYKSASYNDEGFIKVIMDSLETALINHQEMALKEGAQLKGFFVESYNRIEKALKDIEGTIPEYKERCYTVLKENIESLLADKVTDDMEKRLFLEAAIYVDKSDVTEEIIRLRSHLKNYWEKLHNEDSDIGKSLNFIFQEMQREINTISSKFNHTETFQNILLIKEEVEKCREQIQNVE